MKNGLRNLAAALLLATAIPWAPALADARSEAQGSFDKALALFNAGDYRAARIEILRSLKANPNDGKARLLAARTALELGSGVAAQTEIERAVAGGVPRDRTYHLTAHALLLQGDSTRALETADPARVPPQFAAYAARIRGKALASLDRPAGARAEFDLAVRLAPNDADTLVDASRFYLVNGDRPKGEALVDQVLSKQPTHAKALLVKGNLVRSTQGLQASLPYFNRALQADPNNVEALLERAATFGDLGREKEARADIKRIYAFFPDHPLALYLEAVIEARAGNYAKAQELMTRTKGLLNSYPPALLLQGVVAYQTNNLAQANEYLAKVVAANPKSDFARKLYAAAQLRKGDAQGAIDTLKPVMAKGNVDARTLALAGSAHAQIGDFETSQQLLERATEAAPEEASLQTQLAMAQIAQGDTAGASRELADVLKKDPDSLQGLMMVTLLNLKGSKFKDALTTSNRIIEKYPDLPMGYNLRGAAALGLNNAKAAEANFRLAIQKKPEFTEARRNLAQILVATGRYSEAKRELGFILERNKQDARAMQALAQIAAREGKRDEQLNWSKQAAAASPQSFGARASLIQNQLARRDLKAALDESSTLIRDFPRDPRALELAANVNIAAGRFDQAQLLYSQVISAEPNAVRPRLMYARSLEAGKKIDEARTAYGRALTLPDTAKIAVYADLIAFEARQNRISASESYAAKLRALTPKQNLADIALGDAYRLVRQPEKAVAAYEAARKIRFDRTAALKSAGGYMLVKQPNKALGVLGTYSKAQPQDRIVRAAIADIHMQTRNYKAAIPYYQRLDAELKGKDAGVANNLAYAYQMVGDKRMVEVGKRAYTLAPNAPAIADTYGWILITSKGDRKLALTLLEKAAQGAPGDPNIRYHLAEAYRLNGKTSDAVRELRTALKVPQFDSRTRAQTLLAQLQR